MPQLLSTLAGLLALTAAVVAPLWTARLVLGVMLGALTSQHTAANRRANWPPPTP
jgi:hypothetical protein